MSTSIGYVYILTNKHVPSLVKVGYTNRNPYTRADELSNVTGVPGKWIVFHSWKLENAYDAEQQIFTSLKRYRETGEFLKLRPDAAVEKISVVLAANGLIDSTGLSLVARAEAEETRKKQQRMNEQAEFKQLFLRIHSELREATKHSSNAFFEKNLPKIKQNKIRNTLIWGSGTFFIAIMFIQRPEVAFILASIVSLFAYVVGDGYAEISNSEEAKQLRTLAIRNVWAKNGFDYLFKAPTVGYRDSRGFVFDDANQYKYTDHYTIQDRRSGVKYERDHEYVSVGDYLPAFQVVLPTKKIIVAK